MPRPTGGPFSTETAPTTGSVSPTIPSFRQPIEFSNDREESAFERTSRGEQGTVVDSRRAFPGRIAAGASRGDPSVEEEELSATDGCPTGRRLRYHGREGTGEPQNATFHRVLENVVGGVTLATYGTARQYAGTEERPWLRNADVLRADGRPRRRPDPTGSTAATGSRGYARIRYYRGPHRTRLGRSTETERPVLGEE